MKMIKIMFVCHGNICRSPMAEFIMKNLVVDAGLSERFIIKSSATSTEEIWGGKGNPIHSEAAYELCRHAVPYEQRRATLLKKSDYSEYEIFVGMDFQNERNMHRIFGQDPDKKIKMLMDFTEKGGEVSDPYYTGEFEKTYNDIYEGCKGLLADLMGKNIEKDNFN